MLKHTINLNSSGHLAAAHMRLRSFMLPVTMATDPLTYQLPGCVCQALDGLTLFLTQAVVQTVCINKHFCTVTFSS